MFYEISDNINNKMIMIKYIEILNEYVKFLLIENYDFILKEDSDSNYSKSNNNNIVQQ